MGIFSAPAPLEQAVQRLSASDVAARLNEHGDDLHNWENEFGVVTTLSHSLVKGMTLAPPPPPLKFHGIASDLSIARNRPPEHGSASLERT